MEDDILVVTGLNRLLKMGDLGQTLVRWT